MPGLKAVAVPMRACQLRGECTCPESTTLPSGKVAAKARTS